MEENLNNATKVLVDLYSSESFDRESSSTMNVGDFEKDEEKIVVEVLTTKGLIEEILQKARKDNEDIFEEVGKNMRGSPGVIETYYLTPKGKKLVEDVLLVVKGVLEKDEE